MLTKVADLEQFKRGKKAEQAELIAWFLFVSNGHSDGVTVVEIVDAFELLHLPKGNATRIREHFRKSRNIRKIGSGKYAPTRTFMDAMEGQLEFEVLVDESLLDTSSFALPPFVDPQRQDDLGKMVRVYSQLFLLENSMRGLIEKVLNDHLGTDWWDKAANSSLRQKHEKRQKSEASKKWAPTRSDFGPLYALDWLDLISLMRKYPEQFKPYLGDINFLHRFEDTGTFRNVVAHNGVLREQDDFDRIRIYYQDWIKQLTDSSARSA